MIKLSKPNIPDTAISMLVRTVESGNLVYGETGTVAEGKLSQYLNAKHCLLVSSGTAALHLSLLALNIKPGDKIGILSIETTSWNYAVAELAA